MKRFPKSKLQRLIDAAVYASNRMHETHTALNDFCVERYGFAPGDRDVDEIIDGCFGGAGGSTGMSADAFEAAMLKAREGQS